MLISDMIDQLQTLEKKYGDLHVIIRADCETDSDTDVGSVYVDAEANQIVISDFWI